MQEQSHLAGGKESEAFGSEGQARPTLRASERGDWEIDERMPRFDDKREFDVWLRSGSVRRVRRIGNRSEWFTPGVLVFTDCSHPTDNMLCEEDAVAGWRYSGRLAPPMPRGPIKPLLSVLFGYDAAAHLAGYPGY